MTDSTWTNLDDELVTLLAVPDEDEVENLDDDEDDFEDEEEDDEDEESDDDDEDQTE